MGKFRITGPDGGTYEVNAPDGASEQDVLSYVQQNTSQSPAPEPQGGGMRKAVLGARGANDSIAETLGALPDLVSTGLDKVGLGVITPHKDTGETDRSFYTDKLKALIASLGGPGKEDAATGAEKFAYGAGHGVGDAAAVFIPATAVARTARAGTLAAEVAKTAAAQPVTQALSGAMGEGTADATGSPLAGLLATIATPMAIGGAARVISPGVSQLSAEQSRLANILRSAGIELTPGQATGSKPIQTAESVLDNLPFSAGMGARESAGQTAAFNRAVLSRAGVTADAATPDVMDSAFKRLGNEFERISAQTTVNLDNQFLGDLQQAATRYGTKLPSQTREVFNNYLTDILNSGNQMPGDVYQVARSDMTRQARSLTKSDPALSDAIRGIRNALDGAANRSVPPALADAWQTTRGQYANLKTISKAMQAQGVMPASGEISPAQLYSAARQAVTGDQFTRGAGDLNDLARAGEVFLKSSVPNSGTAQRSLWQMLLTHAPAAMVGGAGAGAVANPASIPAIIAALATPPAVKAAMQSRLGSGYLTNQLAANAGPKINGGLAAALLAAQGKEPALGYVNRRN